jgi:hypothetical protein
MKDENGLLLNCRRGEGWCSEDMSRKGWTELVCSERRASSGDGGGNRRVK